MDYKDLMQVVCSRRSIRRFTGRRVDRERIEQLVEAASWAPSNHNRQGWKFIIFEAADEIHALAERSRRCVEAFLAETRRPATAQMDELVHFTGAFEYAPVVILVMHKKSPAVGKAILAQAASELASGEVLSAAAACQNLLLAAHVMGLGACMMTAPLLAGEVWKSLDSLPAGYEPTCLIALGYPDEAPAPPKRKKLEHIVEYRNA
ncbi:MAG: nitroreductase family protein [Phycisphaerae bacterium]|nr:nitroreductase family protein [Phycisphaerae bacterium]